MKNEKVNEITRILNTDTDPAATEEMVKSHLSNGQEKGSKQQKWLDSATPAEIAEWIAKEVYN